MRKTFKREMAVAGLLVWLALTVKLFFLTAPADISAFSGVFVTVSGAVWTYAGAAFGLHAWQVNGLPGSGAQPPDEFVGENVLPGEGLR